MGKENKFDIVGMRIELENKCVLEEFDEKCLRFFS